MALFVKLVENYLHSLKIQRTSPNWGPRELRERVGRGEMAATSTSRASSLLQARFDEGAVAIYFGEP